MGCRTMPKAASSPLYEDENGYYFDGQIDAEIFSAASSRVGRNNAPALLCDLYYGKSLDLAAHPSVVARAWSLPEYPERCIRRGIWVQLFRTAGYTHDGQPASPPTEPITVYRGCTPDGRAGMAWTSDLAMARRFAHDQLRRRPVGHVYSFPKQISPMCSPPRATSWPPRFRPMKSPS